MAIELGQAKKFSSTDFDQIARDYGKQVEATCEYIYKGIKTLQNLEKQLKLSWPEGGCCFSISKERVQYYESQVFSKVLAKSQAARDGLTRIGRLYTEILVLPTRVQSSIKTEGLDQTSKRYQLSQEFNRFSSKLAVSVAKVRKAGDSYFDALKSVYRSLDKHAEKLEEQKIYCFEARMKEWQIENEFCPNSWVSKFDVAWHCPNWSKAVVLKISNQPQFMESDADADIFAKALEPILQPITNIDALTKTIEQALNQASSARKKDWECYDSMSAPLLPDSGEGS